MNIINIFKKGTRQLNSGVDTWMVEWDSYEEGFVNIYKRKHYQAFTSKEDAEEFGKDLKRAHKLLGNKAYSVTVTKQTSGL